ncbi:hypothetical protein MH117_18025 [Paenibacillus sp. ACRRX]|uniref:hypothetical protein n=1 Tax=Paenibacillus sp. ACRRX TaxID=2918206 RepID=UPI001EF73E49|nr:hypothetical protein [Paenibacillus sp. ACRRX]MCG7409318.1 hypothetical protein [Paenibacillus sp. ACRRX]
MTDFTVIKKLFHITKRNGFSYDEIQTIKHNFGELPQVFIDYYVELGKDERLNHTQDSLIKPEQLQYFKHSEYLIFYCENQRVCVWGIHKNDLSRSNPPVYMSFDEKVWIKDFETLTDFFHAMAYLQTGFALEYGCESFYSIKKTDLDFIRDNYNNKGISFRHWIGIEFYGNYDDSIITVMKNNDSFDLIYASSDKEHYDEMDRVLSKRGVVI